MVKLRPVINKLVTFLKSLKIKHKIALSTASILILSTIMTLTLLYGQFKHIVEKYSYNETHQMVVQLANYYDEKLTKVVSLTQSIFENVNFQESLDSIVWNEQFNYAKEASTFQPLFHRTMLKDRLIESYFLYTPRAMFYDNIHRLKPEFAIERTGIYKAFESKASIVWKNAGPDEVFENHNRIMPIVMSVTTERTYDRAFLVVNMSEREFIQPLKDINETNKASVYIVNSDGQLVTASEYKNYREVLTSSNFGSRLQDGSDGNFKWDFNHEKLYINYAGVKLNGWKVITVQPEKELLREVGRLQLFTVLIGLVFLTVAVLLAFIVAATVTRPIYRLRRTMESVESGKLDARFTRAYMDEIGQLGTSFNSMLEEIQTLILQLEEERIRTKEEQRLKEKAEIKALQAQINPHFLYNTLDTIYWKAKMGENEQVSEMIVALSSLLRIGLSKGKDKIPVLAEIEHVKHYLYLQSNVYNDRFKYNINIKGNFSKHVTVKFILQPIVENSLLHGFENIDYVGLLDITVEAANGKVIFRVEDNGRGFDVEAVKAALRDPAAEAKGYALKNVFQRVVLNYGSQYGINLQSKPYEKTVVEIVIPEEEG